MALKISSHVLRNTWSACIQRLYQIICTLWPLIPSLVIYPKVIIPNRRNVFISSVAQSCPTLCDPMDCSTPGFPVHHQLPEPAQTPIRRVSDVIQPSHPALSPSPPAFSLHPSASWCPRVFSGTSKTVLCLRS